MTETKEPRLTLKHWLYRKADYCTTCKSVTPQDVFRAPIKSDPNICICGDCGKPTQPK